jgi:hypothetical protein
MRAGVAVSVIGHVGAVMMTMLAWQARTVIVPSSGAVVPVEIVDVAPESNVRALAIPTPEEEEATPEEQEPTEAEATPTPTSAPTPTRPQQRREEFNLDDIAAGLINREKQNNRPRSQGEASTRNQEGAGLGTAEVAALEDRARALARAHLRRCWRMPVDLPDPDRLVVTVEFDINRNGTLNGQPRVISPRNYTFDAPMRSAVEAALRAVRQCDPYPFPDDPVVGEHYDVWRRTEFTFRPRL